ncbi:MAG: zinc finger Ran-binding domain-containing protein [Lachnospiraceae bacterium]|nr:zinc finger Ran-binding domain-containing protein [Lachnospiraceae bacterium]
MAEKKKIVEGYWDCPFCGNKGISGLKRDCPDCGRPRGENTKFYLKKEKKYLDDEQTSKVGEGPDWYCEYCGSLNSSKLTVCSSCGAEREDGGKTYEDVKNADQQKEERRRAEEAAYEAARTPKKAGKGRFILLGILLALAAFIVFTMIPKKDHLKVKGFAWNYNINVEEERLVEDSGWSKPSDMVDLLRTNREIHHYDQVLDHYETKTTMVDAGNGTFEERTSQEPVYRKEPVYQTKYYYTVYRWFDSRDVTTSGADHDPYWGDPQLASNERELSRDEVYEITATNKKDKEKTYRLSKEDWESVEIGDEIDVEVLGGKATIKR